MTSVIRKYGRGIPGCALGRLQNSGVGGNAGATGLAAEGVARAASYISSEWLKLIVANAEQFGILSIVTALAVRFLFWEDWEENYRMRKTYMEELERKFDEASESDSVSVDTNTSER